MGHWLQTTRAAAVNEAIIAWLPKHAERATWSGSKWVPSELPAATQHAVARGEVLY